MHIVQFECRWCKCVTDQIVRIVTDNLPPNVQTIQCVGCSKMTVALIGQK